MSTDRAHPDAELSEQQLIGLREQLIDERRKLTESLSSLADDLGVRPDCSISDWADAASYSETRRRTAEIAIGTRTMLTSVEDALERMATGTYGVSEKTGEAIPYERLHVLPWAQTTVDE